jgi:putative two-component system response regulator
LPETILIADDHESSLWGLEGLLSAEGFAVVTASDGEAAMTEFRRGQPDLLLLDVQMPRMSGFEVCRRIKGHAETRLIPVILITGLSATQDRLVGIEAGADDFLTKPVDREQLLARVRSLLRQKAYTDELERAEAVLFALARSIEGKDPYTEGHCERLADMSARLGEFIGLEAPQITALRRAGVVHDIGKVAVPDHILLKPGPLTKKEREFVQRHPVVGEGICSPLKSFQLVLPIIRHHHEKMDGTGYPDGLKGRAIPVTARVLQIVDVFDALSTARPYKKAMQPAEALTVMEKRKCDAGGGIRKCSRYLSRCSRARMGRSKGWRGRRGRTRGKAVTTKDTKSHEGIPA